MDSLSVRAWVEPFGFDGVHISRRQAEQFYVSRDGQLRCKTAGGHQLVSRGRPEYLRYVEQQLEEHLHIQDEAVDGEWRSTPWLTTDLSECPHCRHPLSSAELTRQLESAPLPPRVRREDREGEFRVSWHWRGPELIFLTVWLAIWDSVCLAFAWTGLVTVLNGNPAGLSVLLIPHLWIGVGVTYFYLTSLLNRTYVTCDGRLLRIWCSPIPFPGLARQVSSAAISQLYIVAKPGKSTTYNLEAVCDGGEVTLLKNEQPGTLRYLEQELERFLKITNEPVAGQWTGTA